MKQKSQWQQALANDEGPDNLMIDFETFGSNPDTCGIMSVCIQRFGDRNAEEAPHVDMLMTVSMESNYERGLDMDSSQAWWGSPERTAAWDWYVNSDKQEFSTMVDNLYAFFMERQRSGKPYLVWSRGDFDIRILRRLLQDTDLEIPYYVFRDARTFIRGLHIDESMYVEKDGVYHSPAVDCRHCIRIIQKTNMLLDELGFYTHKWINAITDDENHIRVRQSAGTVTGEGRADR